MLTSIARRRAIRDQRPDLRAAILEAARSLLFRRGAEGISARKIAAKAGCSPTAIYLYYSGIDDLLHHLRMEGHRLLARHLTPRDGAGSALSQIEAMGRNYFRFGAENPAFYDLMFLARASRTARRDEIRQEMFPLLLLRDAVERGIERGEVRSGLDPMVAANALWAQVHGVTSLAVQGLLFETAPRSHQAVLEQILSAGSRWLKK